MAWEFYDRNGRVRLGSQLPAVGVGSLTLLPLEYTDTAPDGYLFCDGTIYFIADYPDLFSVIGTDFGGDGLTTFGVPDFQGRFARGVVDGSDAGVAGGAKTHAHTTVAHTHNLPSHRHDLGATFDAHTHSGAGHVHPVDHRHSPGGINIQPTLDTVNAQLHSVGSVQVSASAGHDHAVLGNSAITFFNSSGANTSTTGAPNVSGLQTGLASGSTGAAIDTVEAEAPTSPTTNSVPPFLTMAFAIKAVNN